MSRRGRKALEGPESAREGPPWSTFPEPIAIVLLHLEHRERGYLHIPMADAAYERISRHGPTWDGKPVGTRAIVRWVPPGLNVPLVPGQGQALKRLILESTEHLSEKEPSPFVQRWRERLKRLHSNHG